MTQYYLYGLTKEKGSAPSGLAWDINMVFKLRSSNPCRSFSCDNSEFTQQDDSKKRTAERLCVKDVTFLVKQDLFKGG